MAEASKSAKDRKLEQILNVSTELDLDPIHDVELFWIVEEYLTAPLPANWSKVKTPTGAEISAADALVEAGRRSVKQSATQRWADGQRYAHSNECVG